MIGITDRQKRLLKILHDDPGRQWSFAELGDEFSTSASAIVSMIRSLAKKGHGEFREQVRGEMYLPATPERLASRALRQKQKRREALLGLS